MLTEEEKERAFQILDELFKKYDIKSYPSEDGIARINGIPVDEYFKKHSIFDSDIGK